MLGGDTLFLCFYLYYCFLFHMCYIGYWFILWGYSWYMSFIFCFVKSRIYLFCFTCIFHTWVYVFVECFRTHDVFIFGSWCIYFLWGVYVRGRHYVFTSIIVSCFTCATLAIDLYYKVIHDIFLLFSVLWNQEFIFFVLLVFSTHAFMCLLSISGIYRLI